MAHTRSKEPSASFANAEKCTQCGYCLPVCPTYRVENNELHSPRGRVSIILALRNGGLAKEEAATILDHCLLCQACHAACPAGVRPGKLALQLRAQAPLPASRFSRLFHAITDRPRLTAVLAAIIRGYQRSGLQRWLRRGRLLRWLPTVAHMEAMLPVASAIGSVPLLPAPPSSAEPQPRVALLAGCMTRLFFSSVPQAAAHVLHRWGNQVVVLDQFGCCGAPYRESGDRARLRRQAKRTLDLLHDSGPWQAVVCDSSICAVTLHSYLRLFGGDPIYEDRARQLSAKLKTMSQFLAATPPPVRRKKETFAALAYHDHCQARHGLGIITEPRNVLRPLADQLLELRQSDSLNADGCCGAAGEYQLRHPERSQAIRAPKVQVIQEQDPTVLVGENPGCLLHLAAGLDQKGAQTAVRHLAEVLYEAYCV
ncbi:MAG: (Fe-S)-binding protein [Magnetococcales bacterium]|nr:(Fe-S)-binding protein [Magnetococcales bacterium]MBF0114564.1 (Fe-S)-binding protein [Magnetococcales bacterium]